MKANSLNVVSVNRKVAITGQRNLPTPLATNSRRAIRVGFGRLAAPRQLARSGREAKHHATVIDPKAAQLQSIVRYCDRHLYLLTSRLLIEPKQELSSVISNPVRATLSLVGIYGNALRSFSEGGPASRAQRQHHRALIGGQFGNSGS